MRQVELNGSIEIAKSIERCPYDPVVIQKKIDAIRKAEMQAEWWKRPGAVLMPDDPEIKANGYVTETNNLYKLNGVWCEHITIQ